MKTLGRYLQSFWQEELHKNWRHYVLPMLSIAVLTALQYQFDFESRWFKRDLPFWTIFLRYWGYYALIWGLPLWWIMRRDFWPAFRQAAPWLLAALAIYSFRSAYRGHHEWVNAQSLHVDQNTYYFYWYTVSQWFQALSVMLPLALLAWIGSKWLPAFHGLRRAPLRPYAWLLAGAAILAIGAAQQPDFQSYYPMFAKMWPAGGERSVARIAAFEISYALDFMATEVFFRGFLVLAMARFFGPKAILPMAVLYVSIHFGKPLGETISSFFGGMLLGIFAHYSKSTWGGIMLHIGLAWLMELAGGLVLLGLL